MPFYLAERVFTFDVSVDEIRFDLQIFQAVSVFCYYGEFPGREKLSLILETKCIDNDFSFDIIDMVSVKVTGYIETGSRFGVPSAKTRMTGRSLKRSIVPMSCICPFGSFIDMMPS